MNWWQILLSVIIVVPVGMFIWGCLSPSDGELQNDLDHGHCGGRSLKND